jgi:DNA-binding MarR family transcriptional regulator
MNKARAQAKIVQGANGATPDRESSASERDHTSLRLWLRLLTCTTLIENNVRGSLRAEFSTTLPRFDLMAQLARHPDGLKMGELSKHMMVSGGNVTGITDQLEKDGLVERVTLPGDRRAWKVRLTPAGRNAFDGMAAAHEIWIVRLMDSLTVEEQQQVHALLGKLKQGLRG